MSSTLQCLVCPSFKHESNILEIFQRDKQVDKAVEQLRQQPAVYQNDKDKAFMLAISKFGLSEVRHIFLFSFKHTTKEVIMCIF